MLKEIALLAGGLVVMASAQAGPPMRFDAHLQGYNASGVPVKTSAVGQAKVQIVDDGTAIYYQVEVAGVENAVMAHIHVANAPVQLTDPAGPPVFWFFGGPPPSGGNAIQERINGSLARGYINADSDLTGGTLAQLAAAIMEGRASIILHTTQNPAGELRGVLQ